MERDGQAPECCVLGDWKQKLFRRISFPVFAEGEQQRKFLEIEIELLQLSKE